MHFVSVLSPSFYCNPENDASSIKFACYINFREIIWVVVSERNEMLIGFQRFGVAALNLPNLEILTLSIHSKSSFTNNIF